MNHQVLSDLTLLLVGDERQVWLFLMEFPARLSSYLRNSFYLFFVLKSYFYISKCPPTHSLCVDSAKGTYLIRYYSIIRCQSEHTRLRKHSADFNMKIIPSFLMAIHSDAHFLMEAKGKNTKETNQQHADLRYDNDILWEASGFHSASLLTTPYCCYSFQCKMKSHIQQVIVVLRFLKR